MDCEKLAAKLLEVMRKSSKDGDLPLPMRQVKSLLQMMTGNTGDCGCKKFDASKAIPTPPAISVDHSLLPEAESLEEIARWFSITALTPPAQREPKQFIEVARIRLVKAVSTKLSKEVPGTQVLTEAARVFEEEPSKIFTGEEVASTLRRMALKIDIIREE